MQTNKNNKNYQGVSSSTKNLLEYINKSVKTARVILLQGESGVGKQKLAESIYEKSEQSQGFYAINCAGVPYHLIEVELFGEVQNQNNQNQKKRGLVEAAHEGTLFLHDIDSLTVETQAKILRLIDESVITPLGSDEVIPIHVQLIVATRKDLKTLVEQGVFREDLYYRLQACTVTIEPLRARKEDIPQLVNLFLEDCANEHHVSVKTINPDVMQQFMQYDWPGNVRELKNVISNLVLFSEGAAIRLKDYENYTHVARYSHEVAIEEQALKKLSQSLEEGEISLSDAKKAFEKIQVLKALKKCNGNISTASRNLQMPRPQVSRLVKKYHLKDQI